MTGRLLRSLLGIGLASVLLVGVLPTVTHAAEAVKVVATFDPNGGKVSPTTLEVDEGTPAADFPRPTRDRHTFKGWFTAASGGTRIEAAPNTDFTAFAQRAKTSKITITFDTNGGGKAPADKVVTYKKKLGKLPTVKRSGYTFRGWYTSAGKKVTSSTKATTKSVTWTLYARWAKSRHYVFDANGGTVSTAYKDVKPKAKLGTLPTPKRSGFSFMGWYTKQVHGGTKLTSGSKAAKTAGTTTLYARWAPKPLYQFDDRWRRLSYVSTMRGSGCGLTAMAIAVRAITGKSITPKHARSYALKHDYDVRKPGRTKAGFFTNWPATYGITVTPTNDKNLALQAVKDGNWVVAFMKPGRWTREGHFILWYDVAGSTALIRDPNAKKASKVRAPYKTLQKQTWTGVKGNKHHRYYIVEVPDDRKLYRVG